MSVVTRRKETAGRAMFCLCGPTELNFSICATFTMVASMPVAKLSREFYDRFGDKVHKRAGELLEFD